MQMPPEKAGAPAPGVLLFLIQVNAPARSGAYHRLHDRRTADGSGEIHKEAQP
jgi:hypothetical protein